MSGVRVRQLVVLFHITKVANKCTHNKFKPLSIIFYLLYSKFVILTVFVSLTLGIWMAGF